MAIRGLEDFVRQATDDPHSSRRLSPGHLTLVSVVLAQKTAPVASTDMVSLARDTTPRWYESLDISPDHQGHPGNGSLGRGPMRISLARQV